ncbi:glycosyltransferase family 2 protein [Secundilactobacillus muriivasis]
MNKEIRVDCVVVTYNKLDLLKECITAIRNQNYNITNIFIVDNNSSDGTVAFLNSINDDRIRIIQLSSNIGGAGGFNQGLRNFILNSDSDYVWVMDDDTIPEVDSLEKLVQGIKKVQKVGFVSSNVRWIDGQSAVMNVPKPMKHWAEFAEQGLIQVETTSFVSVLFSREAISEIGLPITAYFIWGDDVEYTLRITRNGFNNYFVSDSKVIHKMKQNVGTDIFQESDSNRIKRYRYANRNAIFTQKELCGTKSLLKEIMRQIYVLFKIIIKGRKHKGLKFWVSFRGTIEGIFFNPRVEKL